MAGSKITFDPATVAQRDLAKRLAASLVAPCLVGCGATQAQLHVLQIVGTAKTTLARYKRRMEPIEAKPEYAVVYEKIAVGTVNQRLLVMKISQKAEALRVGQRLRAALLSEHEQELQQRADVTQEMLDASISLAASLATRQAPLIPRNVLFSRFAREPIRLRAFGRLEDALLCRPYTLRAELPPLEARGIVKPN
jgi:hypothetical protein